MIKSPNVISANIQLISLEFWRGVRRESIFKVVYLWFPRRHKGKAPSLHNYCGQCCLQRTCSLSGYTQKGAAKLTARTAFCLCSKKLIVSHLLGKPMLRLSLVSHLKASPCKWRHVCEPRKEPQKPPHSAFPLFSKTVKFTTSVSEHHDKYLQQ